ncbi:MAG: hypothetical protein CSB21_03450 [Deltaproteobacteria bacterium]|nr:MAG: hypothetical protein CSB21_03450 [Deltaproteobacteria bacterium]
MEKSEIIELKINKKDIAFLKFIFEASEGTGLTSTINANEGRVVVFVPPGGMEFTMEILDSLEESIDFEIVCSGVL